MTDGRWARIDTILQAAFLRPPDARAAFIRDACGDDEALRDEVMSLVGHEVSADKLFESVPAGSRTRLVANQTVRFLEEAVVLTPRLKAGQTLNHFTIVEPIGAGGMGEVYRARDMRLPREVAIKVLPAHVASDPDRRKRLEQEAQAVSALNHPYICTLYDVGHDAGLDFLVMEYVDGETLTARLAHGPLSIQDTIRMARDTAEALAAAHAKDLIHRDIKPSNLIVTPDGHVKVIDFGLARMSGFEAGASQLPSSVTQPGIRVGTPHYMSPEQAAGETLDTRTDIFSLGVVMFECLTGYRPFDGDTRPEHLQSLRSGRAKTIGVLRSGVPQDLQELVGQCLEKDRSKRLESAPALVAALDRIERSPAVWLRVHRRQVARWLVAGGLSVAAIAVLMDNYIPIPVTIEQLTFSRARIGAARFIAGGRSIVYSEARQRDSLELWRIDPAESVSPRSLVFNPGTEILAASANEIALSIDRRLLIGERFVGTLAIAPVGGGTPVKKEENIEYADWDPEGRQLAVVRSIGGIGGTSALEYPIGTKRYETGLSIQFPRVSRDGRRIAFIEDGPLGSGDGGSVAFLDLDSNRVFVLTARFANVRGLAWAADDREIWFTAAGEWRGHRVLRAVGLDRKDRVIRDFPSPGSLTLFDIAADGTVLLTRDDERRSLVGVPPGETSERDLTVYDDSALADVADDGRQLLLRDRYGVYVLRTDGGRPVHLRNLDAYAYPYDLSPDGTKVLARARPGELVIVTINSGAHQTVPKYTIRGAYAGAKWFPDNNRIIFSAWDPGLDHKLRSYIQDLSGGAPTALTPPGIWAVALDDEGTRAAAIGDSQDGVSIWPIPSGPSRLVPGSRKGDLPVAWTTDGRALWMFRRDELPLEVVRLDIETGNRQIWKTLAPSDVTGVYSIRDFAITPSGEAYFYSFRRLLSQLYQVSGLR